jgi:hypothetical protein
MLILTLGQACVTCGEGTGLKDGECVAISGDTAVDTDTDTDTDADGDSDTDTDADTDTDTDSDADADADTDTDTDADVEPGAWSGEYRAPDDVITLAGVRESDVAGMAVAGGQDLTGDGQPDVVVGAPFSPDSDQRSGAVYLVEGPVTGDLSLRAATLTLASGNFQAYLGAAIALPGDVDGDGQADLLISEPCTYPVASSDGIGTVYLLLGPLDASTTLEDAVSWVGEGASANAGRALGAVGDLDGDGFPDLGAGAWGTDVSGADQGAAYLLFGPTFRGGSLEDADVRLYGDNDADSSMREYFGSAVVGLGDIDGDGSDDLAVSAGNWSGDDYYAGVVRVWYGPVTSSGFSSDADFSIVGSTYNQRVGYGPASVAAPGDLDGDGTDDIAVGSYYGTAAWVVAGGRRSGEQEVLFADATLTSEDTASEFGWTVVALGDVDGDGAADGGVGAPRASEYVSSGGAFYMFFGPVSGSLGVADAGAAVHGSDSGAFLGFSAVVAGDVTGDGAADLLLGAYGATGDVAYAGAAFILPGT